MDSFRALVVDKQNDAFDVGIRELRVEDLPEGDVTLRVAYSSINYKDGMAATPGGRVVRAYPIVPGIDLAGTVVASSNARWREGDEVIATGYELGTGRFGGYGEYARVPGEWLVARPAGLTLREAMIVGTAGFTAALSIQRLEANGLTNAAGPVLVLGATGGVGSHAVAMLARAGYEVTASTGKASEHDYLRRLGARNIIGREALMPPEGDRKPLRSEQWAAAIDPVGGPSLPYGARHDPLWRLRRAERLDGRRGISGDGVSVHFARRQSAGDRLRQLPRAVARAAVVPHRRGVEAGTARGHGGRRSRA